MKKRNLSHINSGGEARMIDISDKRITARKAVVKGRILVSKELLQCLKDNSLAKGDALSAARIAGIMAAKKTSELIPLCHPIPLSFAGVELKLVDDPPSVEIIATVRSSYKTGVEMEALTAVSVAALTIYDMGKSIDKSMVIEKIELVEKTGGRSGSWPRKSSSHA
jgi:cyclic pyranopterin phosphate synthase